MNLARCVIAELLKISTHRVALAGVAVLLVVPVLPASRLTGAMGGTANAALYASQMAQVGGVVIAATCFGQEYQDASLRAALLAVPNRLRLLWAKLIAVVVIVISCATVGFALAVVLTVGVSGLASLWQKVSVAALSAVLLAVFSGALAVVTRSIAVPSLVLAPCVLGLTQFFMGLVAAFKYSPHGAGLATFSTAPAAQLLGVTAGLTVQAVWAVCFGAVGWWMFQRRDTGSAK